MHTTAILTGAGSGSRLGASIPKALVPIKGIPMVRIAADNLIASGIVDEIIVTVPDGFTSRFAAALHDSAAPIILVTGGDTRQQSIWNALKLLNPGCGSVLVHDAARPFAPPGLIANVAAAIHGETKAVIPAQPVTDTVKKTAGTLVRETLDRSTLVAVQTPQGFDRATLEIAYRHAIEHQTTGTDDASLVETIGIPVIVIPGDAAAMKITTPTDLKIATILYS